MGSEVMVICRKMEGGREVEGEGQESGSCILRGSLIMSCRPGLV